MTTKRTSTGLVLAVIAVALTGTAGCSSNTAGQPTPSSAGATTTPTSTVDPNDPQAVAYATATALFEEYFELSQEIRQKPGVPDWESVLWYTSGDVRMVNVAIYSAMVEDGVPQQGEARIVSIVPTSYKEYSESDTIAADVTLTVCIDSSESDTPGWIADPVKSKPGQPDRVLLTYEIRGFRQPQYGGEVAWAIDSAEILEGQAC